jgi:hypothetical protein
LKNPSSGDVAFEFTFSSKIQYVDQTVAAVYVKLPPALAAIKPGSYNLVASIISDDGAIDDEKSVSVNAKVPPNMSTEEMALAGDWGDCITIGTGTDGGAFDCSLAVLGPTPRHTSTQGAFSNLGECLTTKRSATIFGHGKAGQICTESGDHCSGGADDTINGSNGAQWLRHAAKIKDKSTTLKLAGCHTGDTEAGAKLLQKMATAINATVMAPTGLIFCSRAEHRMWIDGVWQSASPNSPAKLVKAESRVVPAGSDVFLYINGAKRTLPRSAVKPIKLVLSHDKQMAPASAPISEDFVAHVDFANPLITDSIPLAQVTGMFSMEIALGNDTSVIKKYRLLADSLLQDQDAPEYYYHLDSVLRERLVSISSQR